MAGDFINLVSGKLKTVAAILTSAGAGDSGKIPKLDANGHLDATFLPTGIGPETVSITCTEDLAAGAFVNVYVSSGTKVRNADATSPGKRAHGFVLSAFANTSSALVYFWGENSQLASLTVGGDLFLSTTPGVATQTAPSGSGNVVQRLGIALSATMSTFSPDDLYVELL